MSRSQRAKGQTGEREAAALLAFGLGRVVKRKLGAARDGGDDIEVGQFSIEVKRRKRIAVTEFMEQAVKNCAEKIPIVMMREDGGDWLVLMQAEHAIDLMREAL